MATVVLTAVGAIIGGPVGAAIGLAAGVSIDSELAQQGTREGPRIGDLRIQTSRYGAAIPRLFGRTRVAGTVIWSTDLIESRGVGSNGKGKGSTATYSYSVSFAVMLSARRVLRIGRIWADGNLLRGSAGDFKTPTVFRLLTGDDDQPLDPLIAAAEGIGATPAYRGRTIAVFEDFQLAAYGNRVPSLSFEVIADESAVSVPGMISELSAGAVTGTGTARIDGIAVTGDSVRGVARAMGELMPLSLRDTGATLEAVSALSSPTSLAAEDFGPGRGETRAAALRLPEALSLVYYDSARDYQPAVQRARRDGGARRNDTISIAAVLGTGTAKALVEARLTTMWRDRRQRVIDLPWRAIALRPGDRVTLPGESGTWRIAAMALERMTVRLTLIAASTGSAVVRTADPGRSLSQSDVRHGPTTLIVLDLPVLGDTAASRPNVVVAANGTSSGWRGAPLLASNDGGVNYSAIGGTALPTVIGRVSGLLGVASTAIADRVNLIDVQLLNDAMTLGDADDAALAGGANLAMIGGEMVQFAKAFPMGDNRWRLSGLWRGRRGTEAAIATHAVGEPFVLIEAAALLPVPSDYAVDAVRVRATGIGDGAEGSEAMLGAAGRATMPMAPVRLTAERRTDGGFDIMWVRRSREGWQWRDTIDVPLAEEREAYRVVRTGTGVPPLADETGQPRWTYTAAQRSADLAAGTTMITVSVVQMGSWRLSDPVTITLPLI